jgi:hypothetical protein
MAVIGADDLPVVDHTLAKGTLTVRTPVIGRQEASDAWPENRDLPVFHDEAAALPDRDLFNWP